MSIWESMFVIGSIICGIILANMTAEYMLEMYAHEPYDTSESIWAGVISWVIVGLYGGGMVYLGYFIKS